MQDQAETATTERAGNGDPPPLGISLAALILIGYMVMSLLGGISMVADDRPLPGAVTIAVSVALVWVGLMLWRRHYAAWLTAVLAFSFLVLTWIAGAVMLGTFVALVYVPLFAAPLLLLFLPSARAWVRAE
jgi:hypothetical protein